MDSEISKFGCGCGGGGGGGWGGGGQKSEGVGGSRPCPNPDFSHVYDPCQVTDEGLRYISTVTSLRDINLNSCVLITDVGVSYLASIECLENINVGYTNLAGELLGWVLHCFLGIKKFSNKSWRRYVPCYEAQKGFHGGVLNWRG